MIAFIIIACILLATVLFLLMRVRLQLTLKNERMSAYLRILFLKIELYSDKKSKIKKSDFKIKRFRRRRDKVLKKYRIKKTPEKKVKREVGKKHTSPLLMINKLKLMFSDAIGLFGKHHRIERFNVSISVGGSDAAKTAINYGYVITSLQFLVTFLENFSNLDKTKNKSADVAPDFENGKWDASLNIIGAVRVIHILKIGLSVLIGYFKHKDVKEPQKAAENK